MSARRLTQHGYDVRKPVSFVDACRLADTYGVSPQTAWIALGDIGMLPENRRQLPQPLP